MAFFWLSAVIFFATLMLACFPIACSFTLWTKTAAATTRATRSAFAKTSTLLALEDGTKTADDGNDANDLRNSSSSSASSSSTADIGRHQQAMKDALEATKKYGPQSEQARVLWEIAEEIEDSIYSPCSERCDYPIRSNKQQQQQQDDGANSNKQ